MDQAQPSRSAQEVALYRAAHQLLDTPRVFDDPLAMRIIGSAAQAAMLADVRRFASSPETRAFLAARSRFAEDALARAMSGGVKQYVLLGAGLDTFAYRNPDAQVVVHEVDHPATQAWKQQRLLEAGIDKPSNVCFLPIDLARESLAAALDRGGFSATDPAFFSMLGLVVFLPQPLVMQILGLIASLPRGSGVAFDYGMLESSLSESQRLIRQQLARNSAAMGEPFQTFFDPPALAGDLRRLGLTPTDDIGFEDVNRRYFQDRADGLRVAPGGRRIVAATR